MTPLNEWLKPPRNLLLILILLTLVSVSALGWFGWKLQDQERIVEIQRSREKLEETADRIAATLRRRLAEAGDRLASPGSAGLPEDGVLLTVSGGWLTALPAGRLLYYPTTPPEPEAPAGVFAPGEVIEFQQHDPAKAAAVYERLAQAPSAVIRAGALLRIGRALRKAGQDDNARSAYRNLATIAGAMAAGVPADLVARHTLCELSGDRNEALALREDLLRARWRIRRGQFWFYWTEVARLTGDAAGPPPERIAFSEAVEQTWEERQRETGPRGQTTAWVGDRPWFVLWRGEADHRSVLIASPASMLQQAAGREEVRWAAVDGDGRLLAGRREPGDHAIRTAGESDLPWTLYFTAAPRVHNGGLLASQRFLLLGTAIMVLFLIAGTYFIAKAIRREMEVARMQSNFVSAVSHEFRSPLTSMRQLSEILALGRVPSEERRHVYYETLVRETVRLQRLVESLLNFGKMEAGARQYRFQTVDAAALAREVAAEFQPQIAGVGRHIELSGEPSRCLIEADPEAMSVALRNLVDNALKYSPDEPNVWVEWRPDHDFVAISVRDRGMGIPVSERKAIFRKFFRGSAAAAGNVKGSGVGLAMVRHIVSAHGGEIRVESEPGHGSTFTMLLPATEAI